MPKGGKRSGAGRPPGSGRYGASTRLVRVPVDLFPEISEILATRVRAEAEKRANGVPPAVASILPPPPERILLLPRMPAVDAFRVVTSSGIKAAATILDPWYRDRTGHGRSTYLTETLPLLNSASECSDHVFVWGHPEALARLMDLWSPKLQFECWITWAAPNSANRALSWRPAQQACIHLRRPTARLYAEQFLSERHQELLSQNKLQYKMTPRNVIFEEPLLTGFIRRREQQGYPAQKPVAVLDRLIRMASRPGDLILDMTAGSGTTGVASIKAGCSAILCDRSPTAMRVMRKRLGGYITGEPADLPEVLY